VRFEWDPSKEVVNRRKHGVSFAEASSIFADPFSATIVDAQHSVGERRFITVGLSSPGRVLVVAHEELDQGLRIISARVATAAERRRYESET
jgi:uncharacterized DUF497 family protein